MSVEERLRGGHVRGNCTLSTTHILYILLSEAFSASYRFKLIERDFSRPVQDFKYLKEEKKVVHKRDMSRDYVRFLFTYLHYPPSEKWAIITSDGFLIYKTIRTENLLTSFPSTSS